MHAMEVGHEIDWRKNTFTSLSSCSRMPDRGRHCLKLKLNADNLSLVNKCIAKTSNKCHVLLITYCFFYCFALKNSGFNTDWILRFVTQVTSDCLVYLIQSKTDLGSDENIHYTCRVTFRRGRGRAGGEKWASLTVASISFQIASRI